MSLGLEARVTPIQREPASGPDTTRNPLLILLVLAMLAGTAAFGFVSVAPNRILSGTPMPLWRSVQPVTIAAMAGAALLLALLARRGRNPNGDLLVALAAAALLLATLWAAGTAASAAVSASGPATRISLGAAFWIVASGAAFALADALGGRQRHIWTAPLITTTLIAAIATLAARDNFVDLSLARELASRRSVYLDEIVRHLGLVGRALAITLPLGAALGAIALRRPDRAQVLFAGLNLVQTIPSIALFGVLIEPLTALSRAVPPLREWGIGGIGMAPAVIALALYGLLPIARAVHAGLGSVPAAARDAAQGMGMSARQIFWRVSVPLASPILLTGLRIVVIQLIGLAVIAALIGAGGLGTFIFQGLGQSATDLILLGALSAVGLALAADAILRVLAALLAPPGYLRNPP